MSSVLKMLEEFSDMQGISVHPAFRRDITGLEAEKMLRGKRISYLYLIREGEEAKRGVRNYYITFVDSNFSVRHQPFTVTEHSKGWTYEQGVTIVGSSKMPIEDVIHQVIHASKESCVPFLG